MSGGRRLHGDQHAADSGRRVLPTPGELELDQSGVPVVGHLARCRWVKRRAQVDHLLGGGHPIDDVSQRGRERRLAGLQVGTGNQHAFGGVHLETATDRLFGAGSLARPLCASVSFTVPTAVPAARATTRKPTQSPIDRHGGAALHRPARPVRFVVAVIATSEAAATCVAAPAEGRP